MKKLYFILTALVFSALGFAQSDVVKFQADISKRNGDVLYIKDNNKIVQEIKLDKGMFKASFAVKEGMYQLFDGVEYAQLYLKNGYDLKMTMDASQFDESIKFSGNGSKENNYLAQETLADEGASYEQMLTLDEAGFKKAMEEKKSEQLGKMNKAGLDANFVAMNKAGFEKSLFGLQQYYTKISENKKMNNTVSALFDYENHKGGKTKLEDLRGKYVYIDVWATWCGPCRAEIPSLKKVEEKFQGKNIAFVSISIDVEKDHEKWQNFVTEKQLGGIQLFADKDWRSDFITSYKINSIPRFLLIDPTGKIVDADAARPSDPRLMTQLASLLE
jgi:thiol-disulfide isomerase/thioredoxin